MTPARTAASLAELLAAGEGRLAACGIERPRLEAEVLMAHALGIDRGRLAVLLARRAGSSGGAPTAPAPTAAAYRSLIKRRGLREPLAYITGRREFWSLDFDVTPDVLIPRPETEILVQEALSAIPASPGPLRPLVVDAGTGSGAVAVSLAVERPAAFVVATDISAKALAVARRNVVRHGVGSRVRLLQADLLAPLSPRAARDAGFRMVVSNPPYVGFAERATLMPEVRDWEPEQALFAGEDGMQIIERLVPQAAAFLRPAGRLAIEVAAARANHVAGLLESSGFWQDVRVREDYSGLPRVVSATAGG